MRKTVNRPGMAGKYLIKYTACCLLISAFFACASVPVSVQKQDHILAIVDGDPITREDLEYSLEVAHRREDMSSAKTLDINGYIEKLINDRLIVQEALRMGIDDYPEVQEKVRAYVLRESVMRLYKDEVLDKAVVSEKDLLDYYMDSYERFKFDIIEAGTAEKAGEILERLKSGEQFEEFSREYPPGFSRDEEGAFVLTKKTMPAAIYDAVAGLNPGEITDVTPVKDKFYIMTLLGRDAPPAEDFESVRANMENMLKKRKIQERSDEYLAQLQREADIRIDRELLSSIDFSKGAEEIEALNKDMRPLVKVNDAVLSVKEFVSMIPSSDEEAKEKVLKRWLDRKLVDLEALSRRYDQKTDLKDKLNAYRNQLIKNTFFKDVMAAKIEIPDSEVREYYLKHREDYVRPVRYKIQKIALKTMEEAQEVIESLDKGANFSWMAKMKSVDSTASRGGVMGWKAKEGLPGPVKEIVDMLEPGDYSPVLQVGDLFVIVRLMEKTEKQAEDFERVRGLVYRAVHRERFGELYDTYVEKLRAEARIEINDEAVRSFEKIFAK